MDNRFLTLEDLGNLPAPKWLIEGLFEKDALVMLVGPPAAFKSFLAIDWALSIALGRPWNGRATEPSRVLYALGEGKASLLKRIEAWIWFQQLTEAERRKLNANFRVTFDVPQFAVAREVTEFLDDLDADGFDPGLLIIDTLARSFVGRDENSQTDAGLWVESADRLRQRGMAVLALHHTKKNTEFGLQYRGSSALQGAMDTAFTLQRDPDGFKGYGKLYCSKQKDHEEPDDIWLRREHVRPPGNEEGSIILLEQLQPGEDTIKEQEQQQAAIDELILGLLADPTFATDRARAKLLAEKANMLEGTAQTRISRARRKIDAEYSVSGGSSEVPRERVSPREISG